MGPIVEKAYWGPSVAGRGGGGWADGSVGKWKGEVRVPPRGGGGDLWGWPGELGKCG